VITSPPTYSGDGSKIAWREQPDGGTTWSIKVANHDGTDATTVVEGTFSAGETPATIPPSISPDGTKLLVINVYTSGTLKRDIYVINIADGSNQTLAGKTPDLVGTGAGNEGAVFVSNTQYAFIGMPASGCAGNGVFIKEIGQVATTLLTGSCTDPSTTSVQTTGQLTASADGAYVAYAAAGPSNKQFVLINSTQNPGTTAVQAAEETGGNGPPPFGAIAFSPDGTKLAYGFALGGSTGIKVAPWNGTIVGDVSQIDGITASPLRMTWVPGNVSLSTTTPAPNPGESTTDENTGSGSGSSGGSTTPTPTPTDNIVPGVTVTDATVYTKAPKKVASNSAVKVMTPEQIKTQRIVSNTPDVCLPNKDNIVFIDEGRCSASILDKKTGEVLRRFRTTVVEDEVSELKVGNEVAILAPIYFDGGSTEVNQKGMKRIRRLQSKITAAGTVLVVGHSGIALGDTEENRILSRQRATSTVAAMKKVGAKGPFFAIGVGGKDPLVTSTSGKDQSKNRRVVIILVP